MKKITILYIDIEGGFGGSSKSLFTMVSSINLDKYAPIVFCKKRGPIYEKLINKGIKCYIEPSINSIIPLRKNNIKNWLAHAPKFLFIKKLVKRISQFAKNSETIILKQIKRMGASLDWSRYTSLLIISEYNEHDAGGIKNSLHPPHQVTSTQCFCLLFATSKCFLSKKFSALRADLHPKNS